MARASDDSPPLSYHPPPRRPPSSPPLTGTSLDLAPGPEPNPNAQPLKAHSPLGVHPHAWRPWWRSVHGANLCSIHANGVVAPVQLFRNHPSFNAPITFVTIWAHYSPPPPPPPPPPPNPLLRSICRSHGAPAQHRRRRSVALVFQPRSAHHPSGKLMHNGLIVGA